MRFNRCIYFGALCGMLLVAACDRGFSEQPAQNSVAKAKDPVPASSVQEEPLVIQEESVDSSAISSASIDTITIDVKKSVAKQKKKRRSSSSRTRSSSSNIILSSESEPKIDTCANVPEGYVCDMRDNKMYRVVKIGSQTWLAENLNYAAEGSWCYDNNSENCEKFGRLYTWASALDLDNSFLFTSAAGQITPKHRGACLEGWHVPSMREIDILETFVNNNNVKNGHKDELVGTSLKSQNGWAACEEADEDCIPGTNRFGFGALPAGWRDSDGSFNELNEDFSMWVANESEDPKRAPYWELFYATDKFWGSYIKLKTIAYSVRCVKD